MCDSLEGCGNAGWRVKTPTVMPLPLRPPKQIFFWLVSIEARRITDVEVVRSLHSYGVGYFKQTSEGYRRLPTALLVTAKLHIETAK